MGVVAWVASMLFTNNTDDSNSNIEMKIKHWIVI
jgi:hypothetical protein